VSQTGVEDRVVPEVGVGVEDERVLSGTEAGSTIGALSPHVVVTLATDDGVIAADGEPGALGVAIDRVVAIAAVEVVVPGDRDRPCAGVGIPV
jgi:hypothetical protein